METCKTCRWWQADDKETQSGKETDYKDIPIVAKPCTCPAFVDTSEEPWASVPDNGAGYSDREGYGARWRTGPDFGCIHHALEA